MSDPHRRVIEALDLIGQKEGSLLYRGPDQWEALEPGIIGQVLAIGQDGLPGWYDLGEIESW